MASFTAASPEAMKKRSLPAPPSSDAAPPISAPLMNVSAPEPPTAAGQVRPLRQRIEHHHPVGQPHAGGHGQPVVPISYAQLAALVEVDAHRDPEALGLDLPLEQSDPVPV